MNIKRVIATATICATTAIGLGAVLPASAQTSAASTPSPSSDTAACSYGQWPEGVQGRPAQLQAGAVGGLYLWHDDNGWHAFVTHANHREVVFRITVTSPSKIEAVETHDESGDVVIEHRDDHSVTLRATNFGYLDGMNFRTACGSGITVAGMADGVTLPTTRVFVGHDGTHPSQFPMTIKRS